MWVIWNKSVDSTFRPDFENIVGEQIPSTAAITINGQYMFFSETATPDNIEYIGAIYGGYVIFSRDITLIR